MNRAGIYHMFPHNRHEKAVEAAASRGAQRGDRLLLPIMVALLPCLLFLFGAPSDGAHHVVEPRMQSVLSALIKPPAGAP